MERSVGFAVSNGRTLDEGAGRPGPGWRFAYIALAGGITLLAFATLLLAASHLNERAVTADPAWPGAILKVDAALAEGDVGAAEQAWQDAYRAALGHRGWESMVAVGDAYLRVGEAAGTREVSKAKARGAYLTALYRARAQRSPEGTVRVGDAFAALGDREAADVCFRIAARLGRQAPEGNATAQRRNDLL